MNFSLKNNWDNLPTGNNRPSPYFSGRSKEIEMIRNTMLYKPSGSILIGAPRGTGKTDLIYSSIQSAKQKNSKFIPVVINASQFAENNKEDILRNLITRIYTSFTEEDSSINRELQSKAATLYYQATSEDFQEEVRREETDSEKNLVEDKSSEINLSIFSFDSKKLIDALRKGVVPAFIPLAVLISSYIDSPWILILAVIFLTTIAIFLGIDFSIKTTKEKQIITKNTNEKDVLVIAKTRYLRDASIGNLEYELKELLEMATKDKYKIVFVIDELDKIATDASKILDVVKVFKGLFNHADALFVFVSDSSVYKLAETARLNRDTDAASTLFTQRIYLNRPNVIDIREYLSKVIVHSKSQSIEDLQDLIIFNSRMDYYRIQDSIRDLITSYEKDSPVIAWDSTEENKQIVNKQRVISSLLEDGGYLYEKQSDLSLNGGLIESAYDAAIITDFIEFPVEFMESDYQEGDSTQIKLKADVAKYLHIVGIYQREIIDKEGRNFYKYTSTSNPGKRLGRLSEPLEFEKELFDALDKFEEFLLNIDSSLASVFGTNIKKNVDDDLISELNERTNFSDDLYKRSKTLANELKANPAIHSKGQEEIKKFVDSIRQHQVDMVKDSTFKLIKIALDEMKISYAEIVADSNGLDPYPSIKNYFVSNTITGFTFNKHQKKPRLVVISVNPQKSIVTDDSAVKEVRSNKIIIHEVYYEANSVPNLSRDESKLIKVYSAQDFELKLSKLLK